MGGRVVNGNDHSEDGWPLVDQAGCTWVAVPGCDPQVSIQVQSGIPATILGSAFIADINAFVQKVRDADTGSWTDGNSVLGQPGRNNGSNHLGGTAVDVDWDDHPMGPLYAGWTQAQIDELRRILAFYTYRDIQLVWWGEDWNQPHDSMHFQMGYDTYTSIDVCNEFIAKFIRSDGFSTYRRGAAVPAPAGVDVLARATGLSQARAAQLRLAVTAGLRAASCTNPNRIAMWLAQCGEESAGFATTEEYASGAEYEGRCSDLGNCSPGDGVKYKGRTWIQITGKAHYEEFSRWVFGKGLDVSPTQFVDDPGSLGDLTWAGVGAAWYWTVARPDINALSDARDVVTVTHRINGGEHGLADRQARFDRASALGDQLLTLLDGSAPTTGEDDLSAQAEAMILEMYNEYKAGRKAPSRSFMAPDQTPIESPMGYLWNIDGNSWNQEVTWGYLFGVTMCEDFVHTVAATGVSPQSWAGQQVNGAGERWLSEFGQQWCQGLIGLRSAMQAAFRNAGVAPVAPQAQVTYIDRPVAPQAPIATVEGDSKGALLGRAYDALEALKLSDALPADQQTTLDAFMGVLKTGVNP